MEIIPRQWDLRKTNPTHLDIKKTGNLEEITSRHENSLEN
jgi:hypothetical protein